MTREGDVLRELHAFIAGQPAGGHAAGLHSGEGLNSMAVFISYSHSDAAFVDALAGNLFRAKTPVWVDRWELNVGDSLIRRVEEALTKASAIVFVLSKASIASEWCRKELSSGLIRELDEKHVLVLPALLEDCEIPLFLREKKYADFRTDFDRGLGEILDALARVTNDAQGRTNLVKGHVDWSSDWSIDGGRVTIQLIAVEQAENLPFTMLSLVSIQMNQRASQRHIELAEAGLERVARQLAVTVLAETACDELFAVIPSAEPVDHEFRIRDEKAGFQFWITAECHRLGIDTGKDLILDLGKQIQGMAAHSLKISQPPLSDRQVSDMRRIFLKYRPDLPI